MFANVNWCRHCIGGSTSREREREVCVCVCVCFNFVRFFVGVFYSENSSTYFKVLCRSLQKKNLIVRDV